MAVPDRHEHHSDSDDEGAGGDDSPLLPVAPLRQEPSGTPRSARSRGAGAGGGARRRLPAMLADWQVCRRPGGGV